MATDTTKRPREPSIEEEKDETKRVRQSNEIYFLKSLFSNFDHDGDGFLSLEELRRLSLVCGYEISSEELRTIILDLPPKGEEMLDFGGFSVITQEKFSLSPQNQHYQLSRSIRRMSNRMCLEGVKILFYARVKGANVRISSIQFGSLFLQRFKLEMQDVAEDIAHLSNGRIVLGRIEWGKFDDGWPNIHIHDVRLVRRHDVVFLCSMHDPVVVFEQIAAVHALAGYGAKSLMIILPWFPTGTMERIDRSGQVATAMTMARLLSSTPPCQTGPPLITILDIHALQEQFYFSDAVHITLKSCVRLLISRLQSLEDNENIAIVFPDQGAAKRFKAKFAQFPIITCEKSREGDKRIVSVKEGSAVDKHCVIVDDLVQSGGTLLQCIQGLQRSGASAVSCYVTHAIFPKESWRKFLDIGLCHFFVINTVPTVCSTIKTIPPFEVISCAPLLEHIITST